MSLSRQNIISILTRDIDIVGALVIALLLKNRRRRRFGVNPMNRNRHRQGFYHNLVQEMKLNNNEYFINYHRMTPAAFDELLSIVGPSIQRHNVGERSITAGQRLSLTLRYLASGDSMISLGRYAYRIGQTTTSFIIRETCVKLWEVLKGKVFPEPTAAMWKDVAKDFEEQWNFPHCLGAMDGKHVIIQSFANSGSFNYNYKHSHSIILFAIADANYKFIMVEIGAPGHVGDSTIFKQSSFGKAVLSGGADLNLPGPDFLRDQQQYPYVFVGDEAFPLLTNLMRPYPGRNTARLPVGQNVFNYRLSRARRVVENTFGILASRWRIYRKPIIAKKVTVMGIIKATVVLHNWLREKKLQEYMADDLVDSYNGSTRQPGTWRTETQGISGMQRIHRVGSNNPSRNAVEIRDQFNTYLNEVDVLPWQHTTMH